MTVEAGTQQISAAGDPQQPGELDVLEVEEAALVPAAEPLEQRPAG